MDPEQRSIGESRNIEPGDAVIIPAGVADWWDENRQPITYMVIRVDPEKIMPLK